MAYNKIIYDGNTLIDLTDTTAIAENVLKEKRFYTADGVKTTGTFDPYKGVYIDPIDYDYVPGYTNTGGGWVYENSTNNRTDIYQVQSKHVYILSLGATVGTRFRAGYSVTYPPSVTSGTSPGTFIHAKNNPTAHEYAVFVCSLNGYAYVTKDNKGKSGLKSYLLDITNIVNEVLNNNEFA